MKKYIIYLLTIMLSFSVMSCVTETYAQPSDAVYEYADETVSDAHLQLVITYGTPYIVDDVILYYIYNGRYYYPYYYRSYFYLRVYSHPLRHYPRYWSPVPRSHWYHNGTFHRPHRNDHHGVGKGGHRPPVGKADRIPPTRSSTRATGPEHRQNQKFGGKATPDVRKNPTQPTRPNTKQTTPPTSSRPNNQVFRGSTSPTMRQTAPSSRGGGFGGARPSSGGASRPSGGGGHFGGRR